MSSVPAHLAPHSSHSAAQTSWNDGAFTTNLENLVWTASPVTRRYLHVLVSGRPDCDWSTFVESRQADG